MSQAQSKAAAIDGQQRQQELMAEVDKASLERQNQIRQRFVRLINAHRYGFGLAIPSILWINFYFMFY